MRPNNYEHPVGHEIASAYWASGSISLTTLPWPTLFSADQTVLYRGKYQYVSFRGTTLQGAGAANSKSAVLVHVDTYAQTLASADVSNVSQFGATLGFVTPATTPTGNHWLSILADHTVPYVGGGGAMAGNEQQVYVADPTPVLNPLSPSSGQQGSAVGVTLTGAYFGANPRVCINGACNNGSNTQASSNGVTLSQAQCSACSTQIPITLQIASNANSGAYSISVISRGAMGDNFAPAPQGQTQPQSVAQTFQVQAQPVSVRLERVGETIINSSNNYSEDTTIRVTAVNPATGATLTAFTGTVNIAEDGTAIYSENISYGAKAGNEQQVYVADPTPVLNPLSPSSGQQGTEVSVTLTGAYFGANPRVCINGACTNGSNTQASSNGVTLSQAQCSACSTQIPITLQIAANANSGTYSISVISRGAMGDNFAPAPQGGSQDQSGSQTFQVQQTTPAITSLTATMGLLVPSP